LAWAGGPDFPAPPGVIAKFQIPDGLKIELFDAASGG